MNALVLTISDRISRGEAVDTSGPAAVELLAKAGIEADLDVVADGVNVVAERLRRAVLLMRPLVITTGGTGVAQRDQTPEATLLVIEREVPGLAEAMRSATFGLFPAGMLGRGVAGIAGSTLIVNMPGSEKAVRESMEIVLPSIPHAIQLLSGDTEH
jgi:molybdopterin adenylyltransferase